MSDPTLEKPWHSAFPAPISEPERVSAEELHSLLVDSGTSHNAVLVVDVRRTDFEGSFIKGAINLPAHSFYPTLPGLVPLLSQYKMVVFHCVSSNGRGPRAAGWYQDALDNAGITPVTSRAVVLAGGIKGWIEKYAEEESVTQTL